MKGAVLHGPRDVRFEHRPDPEIVKPTDAIVRMAATCVCGSDLWPYRGVDAITKPMSMGDEYCGFVEEVGSEVRNIKRGQFVVGSFVISDNTCPITWCRDCWRLRMCWAPAGSARKRPTYSPATRLSSSATARWDFAP